MHASLTSKLAPSSPQGAFTNLSIASIASATPPPHASIGNTALEYFMVTSSSVYADDEYPTLEELASTAFNSTNLVPHSADQSHCEAIKHTVNQLIQETINCLSYQVDIVPAMSHNHTHLDIWVSGDLKTLGFRGTDNKEYTLDIETQLPELQSRFSSSNHLETLKNFLHEPRDGSSTVLEQHCRSLNLQTPKRKLTTEKVNIVLDNILHLLGKIDDYAEHFSMVAFKIFKLLLPHLNRIINDSQLSKLADNTKLNLLFYHVSMIHYVLGNYDLVLIHLGPAYAQYNNDSPPSKEKAAIEFLNALIYGWQGEYEKHIKSLDKVLDIYSKCPTLNMRDLHIAHVNHTLANANGALGNWDKQRVMLLEHVLPIYKKRSGGGESGYKYATALHDLTRAYRKSQKLELIQKCKDILMYQVLPVYEKHYGENHPLCKEVTNDLNELLSCEDSLRTPGALPRRDTVAHALRQTGSPENTTPQDQQLHATDNIKTPKGIRELIRKYNQHQDNPDEQIQLIEPKLSELMPMCETNNSVLGIVYSCAGAYYKKKDYDNQIRLLEFTIPLFSKSNNFDKVRDGLFALSDAYCTKRNFTEQKNNLLKLLELDRKSTDPDDLISTLQLLIECATSLQDYALKAAMLRNLVDTLKPYAKYNDAYTGYLSELHETENVLRKINKSPTLNPSSNPTT